MADMDEYLNDLIKFRQKLNNGIHKYEMNGLNGYDNNNEINDDKECDKNGFNTHDHNEQSFSCSPDITKRLLRLLNICFDLRYFPFVVFFLWVFSDT